MSIIVSKIFIKNFIPVLDPGAALGPLLTGIMEDRFGWGSVFYMLFGATIVAMLVSCDSLA